MQTVRLTITGKVQGVFYRAGAKERAEELGLKGWVRNIAGGAVEITVSGDEATIEEFTSWCRRGPSKARVEKVTRETISFENFSDFRIIR